MKEEKEIKKILFDNREFLKELYQGVPIKDSITLNEIDSLIFILCFIAKGKIPLKKIAYKELHRKKITSLLHRLFNKENLKKLLEKSKSKKINLLKKFNNYFQYLFYCLFKNEA